MALTCGSPLFPIFQTLDQRLSVVWSGHRYTATTAPQSWELTSKQSWAFKYPFLPGLASKSFKFKISSSQTSLSDVLDLQHSNRGGLRLVYRWFPLFTCLWCGIAVPCRIPLVNLLCDKQVLAGVCRTCLHSVLWPSAYLWTALVEVLLLPDCSHCCSRHICGKSLYHQTKLVTIPSPPPSPCWSFRCLKLLYAQGDLPGLCFLALMFYILESLTPMLLTCAAGMLYNIPSMKPKIATPWRAVGSSPSSRNY